MLKGFKGDSDQWLIIDDLVDTGRTAEVVRKMLPKAHFATIYAKPAGRPLVDTFITEVSDGVVSVTNSFVVTVTETNGAPVFDGTPLDVEIVELTLLSVTNNASDSDVPPQTLGYSLLVGPTNASIDTNGVISWTPTEAQGPSTNTITTVAPDGIASATNSFVVTVTETNGAPVFDGTPLDIEIVELTLLSVTNSASDSDVDPTMSVNSTAAYGRSIGDSGAVSVMNATWRLYTDRQYDAKSMM